MKKVIAVGIMLFLFVQTSVASEQPTAKELLIKYAETADKAFTSFIIKSKTEEIFDNKFAGKFAYMNGKRTVYLLQEFCTDGRRLKHINQQWGQILKGNKLDYFAECDKGYLFDLYNGEKRYQYNCGRDSPGYVILNPNEVPAYDWIGKKFGYDMPGAPCLGYLHGDFERFDRILKKAGAGQVSVRDKMENINGVAHYVIDAKTRDGQYTVWFNPERGYSFSKAVVRKKDGNLYNNGELRKGDDFLFFMENTHFRNVNGIWLPDKTKMEYDYKLSNGGHAKRTYNYELISILIDPNHDALGSFLTEDIKDGAIIISKALPHGKYIWKDGKVINKKDGRVVLDCNKKTNESNNLRENQE